MPPTTPITAQWPVGSVLLYYPQTLGVFKRFGVDVYRDWPLTLGEAAEAEGVDLAALLRSLWTGPPA
ncbi:MAG TPA: hypothetical protein VKA84_25385 [Gemmatimonadaceae bacterium]|nr:hypothetical protein [Gemmatimonadaceae bacterium]